MVLEVRRVVTGHDAEGRAIVAKDEVMREPVSTRKGIDYHVVWADDALPADNMAEEPADATLRTVIPGGSVFRVIDYHPGLAPRVHRTESVDYAVVLSGEIDLELDGETVHLKAGDVVVQRGTRHNWVNNGTEVCRMAFVLLSARPVAIAGDVLGADG